MIFEQIVTGGCQSYLLGCVDTRIAVLIDPEIRQVDHYLALATQAGLRIRYVIDTHTHADHFSAAKQLGETLGVPVVMHHESPAPFVGLRLGDGEMLALGKLRLHAMHTPGHTQDSMSLVFEDRVFTGDALLIGATGRTDLPTGNPDQLYDSLFGKLLKLDSALKVYPAHDYKGRSSTTIAEELANNPRLQKRERTEFTEMMRQLNLTAPDHLTEALRANLSGAKTVTQLLAEASAMVPFMAPQELKARLDADAHDLLVLDVREKDSYDSGHIPSAKHLPRGQLELRVNKELPDPTLRIVACCELGAMISTLAVATLRQLGFSRAAALDGGMKAWRASGYPVEHG